MGRLTTHILDTAQGKPASDVAVRLYEIGAERTPAATTMTNQDGRTDVPLLDGDTWHAGVYEIEFDIGPYFREQGVTVAEPAFLETVVVRVTLDSDEHYHVPLLASPWSYSTYRGS